MSPFLPILTAALLLNPLSFAFPVDVPNPEVLRGRLRGFRPDFGHHQSGFTNLSTTAPVPTAAPTIVPAVASFVTLSVVSTMASLQSGSTSVTSAPPSVNELVATTGQSTSSTTAMQTAVGTSAPQGISNSTSTLSAAPGMTTSGMSNCEGESNACVGDVTHWDGGLGACGTVVDSDTDYAVALPYELMGTLSNTNPYCGRTVTLLNPMSGTTVQATVRDKCMGCLDRAIDCTNVLFNAITDGVGDGRVHGIEWWFD